MSTRKQAVMHIDDVKIAHTPHWDMDVMPMDELDRLYRQRRRSTQRTRLAGVVAVAAVVSTTVLATTAFLGWL